MDEFVDTLIFGVFEVYNSTYYCAKVKNNTNFGLHKILFLLFIKFCYYVGVLGENQTFLANLQRAPLDC